MKAGITVIFFSTLKMLKMKKRGFVMGRLDGKVIVLSAAAQGIGRASAIVSFLLRLTHCRCKTWPFPRQRSVMQQKLLNRCSLCEHVNCTQCRLEVFVSLIVSSVEYNISDTFKARVITVNHALRIT